MHTIIMITKYCSFPVFCCCCTLYQPTLCYAYSHNVIIKTHIQYRVLLRVTNACCAHSDCWHCHCWSLTDSCQNVRQKAKWVFVCIRFHVRITFKMSGQRMLHWVPVSKQLSKYWGNACSTGFQCPDSNWAVKFSTLGSIPGCGMHGDEAALVLPS